MSRRGRSEFKGIVPLVLIAIVVVICAGALGGWLGSQKTTPTASVEPERPVTADTPTSPASEPVAERPRFIPPLYFYSSIQPGSDIEAVAAEVKMAAAAGVHRLILRIPFPWPEHGPDMNAVFYPLDRIEQENPDAEIFLSVSLNPPEDWLTSHADDAATAEQGTPAYPSIGSDAWTADCKMALTDLLYHIETSGRGERIKGFVLGALEDNRWSQAVEYDTSPANIAGFRAWLRTVYPDESALRLAWGNAKLTFESVEVPQKPDTGDHENVFFSIPDEQNQIDFLRYISEATADVIASLAAHIHQTARRYFTLFVPYGHSLELLANNSGHNALGLILEDEIDGFISPVSYVDRGIGGAGGFMGPVHSARYHSRQWIIVDDTRTGISRNAETDAVERLEGLRTEDVLRVQRRNYAAAMLNGLGLAWADMEGSGLLFEPRIWESFNGMREAYETTWNMPGAPRQGEFVAYATPEKKVTLMIVADERSRFFQRCDTPLNELLLRYAPDAALRVGVPTQFCLLQDVLDGHAAPASVYLFLNAFQLHDEDRERLRGILIANSAAAIWMYAPGYFDQDASAGNVAATTGLKVRSFDGPARAGSTFQLSGGRYLKKGQEFGEPTRWAPLFYLDIPESKVLARYRESERASVGIEFFEEGWASVFLAEPTVTDDLLREILVILEKYVLFRHGANEHSSTAHFGPGVVAIHASSDGRWPIYFDEPFDAVDILNPEVGWLNKLYIPLSGRMGDTTILRLAPAVSDELPEEIPLDPTLESVVNNSQ
ncbi:MAG: hypothetical protein SGI88_05340 [Candidatus Hydrogenedentes bacterium]|nr:hypothetical protein [Candidatus Hydrogenedentota bacterium]